MLEGNPQINPKIKTINNDFFLSKPKSIRVLVASSTREIRDVRAAKLSARKNKKVKNI